VGRQFDILGDITDSELIAAGREIRELARLKKFYGVGRWRKMKGHARVRLSDGSVCKAEIHWYEMTSAGKKELKIKRLLS